MTKKLYNKHSWNWSEANNYWQNN